MSDVASLLSVVIHSVVHNLVLCLWIRLVGMSRYARVTLGTEYAMVGGCR